MAVKVFAENSTNVYDNASYAGLIEQDNGFQPNHVIDSKLFNSWMKVISEIVGPLSGSTVIGPETADVADLVLKSVVRPVRFVLNAGQTIFSQSITLTFSQPTTACFNRFIVKLVGQATNPDWPRADISLPSGSLDLRTSGTVNPASGDNARLVLTLDFSNGYEGMMTAMLYCKTSTVSDTQTGIVYQNLGSSNQLTIQLLDGFKVSTVIVEGMTSDPDCNVTIVGA